MKLPQDVITSLGKSSRAQTPLEIALQLHAHGWNVFPVRVRQKSPYVKWKVWQGRRVPESLVREWFGGLTEANFWIMTGAISGILVLDTDSEAAERFWRQTMGLDPLMDRTACAKSAKGHHYYFRLPGGGNPKGWSIQDRESEIGFDVRAGGGGVIGPPSIHETGVVYEWVREPGDGGEGLVEAPAVLLDGRAARAKLGQRKVSDPERKPTLAELLASPASEGGRNNWLTRVAGHYTRKGWTWDQYVQAVEEANTKCTPPLEHAEVLKVAESIWEIHQSNHGPETEGKEPGKDPAAVVVINYARQHYDFYLTPEGEVFAVPKSGPRRPILMGESGYGLRTRITAELYAEGGKVLGGQTVENALRVVYAQTATNSPVQKLDLRVAYRPGMIVLDLGYRSNAHCVVITADGWTVQDNPPEGVLFRHTPTTKPLPAPERDGSLEPLRGLLGWPADDERWLLVSGWLVAACVPTIPRPLLIFTGQAGSAKTTRAWLTLSVIDPRTELGGSFGRKEDDEQTMAAGRYLVGWDNVTRASDEVSDRLCRVVTGEEGVKRRLYTDTDQVVTSYRRTGAIAAISVPTVKPDALERLIPIRCDRINTSARRSEMKIRQDFERCHAEVLGGLLDRLVIALANLPASRDREADRVRMADFQDVLHAISPQLAEVYARSVENAMIAAAEDDPFVSAVVAWLETQELPLTLGAERAWTEASFKRQRLSEHEPGAWWPKSPRWFSVLLDQNAEPLQALGYRHLSSRTKYGRQLTFYRSIDPPQPTLQDEDW